MHAEVEVVAFDMKDRKWIICCVVCTVCVIALILAVVIAAIATYFVLNH